MFRSYQGLRVKEIYSGTTSQTIALNNQANTVTVINNSGADMTVTINGLTMTIRDSETFDEAFEPFRSIIVSATGSYRIYTRG